MNCTYLCIDRVRPVSYQLTMETFEVEGCVRPSRFPYSMEPHSPRAATGLHCGGDALERNSWPRPSHSLTACSSFPEREESPLSRSLGSIQQLSLF